MIVLWLIPLYAMASDEIIYWGLMLSSNLKYLNDDYLLLLPSIEAISVFDSIYYDHSDLEILSPAQRTYLISKAKGAGFIQTSGKYLTHPDSTRIFLPSQKFFNRNFKSFIPKEREPNTWLGLTPTQAAFVLFQGPDVDKDDLYQLMSRHPFNLDVLGVVSGHEPFYPLLCQLETELRRLYERAQVMLKNKKTLG